MNRFWIVMTLLVISVRPAAALGPKSKVYLAQLRYPGGNWQTRPTALQRLALEVAQRTSIDMAAAPVVVAIGDKSILHYPFLYLAGDRAFTEWSDADVARLSRHLERGAMLLIDSADASSDKGFDRSVRELIGRLLPGRALSAVQPTHALYHSFYKLTQAVGRVATTAQWEGLEYDGRLAIVYSQNDLAGAWARDSYGQWLYNVHPGAETQRERAFRWGVNILMYGLCLDYKDDRAHLPQNASK